MYGIMHVSPIYSKRIVVDVKRLRTTFATFFIALLTMFIR